ncbi:unnamed protein product [Oppiella nova]|uniref:C2H2-type domain-containing protein n=1 Tax=Oppiella nova TaxID=334625 RepID=A0A7R9LZ72_9ACAR|nr:unnamed protein product [Oppiella nova]CAG2167743.1 unnamed protein product [Oppiella nova]
MPLKQAHLKEHIQAIHSTDKPFVCDYENCGKRFPTKSRLRIYGYKHPKEPSMRSMTTNTVRPYQCAHEGCGKWFTRSHRDEHFQGIHRTDRPVVCDYDGCGKRWQTMTRLRVHKYTHKEYKANEFIYRFTGCGLRFRTRSPLQLHRRDEHKDSLLTCEVCDFKTTVPTHLHAHTCDHKQDLSADGKLFVRPFKGNQESCGNRYTPTAIPLTVTSRSTSPPLTQRSNYLFAIISGAENSSQAVTAYGFTLGVIPGCDQVFAMSQLLNDHLKSEHTDQVFVCEWIGCGFTARFMGILPNHVTRVHSAVRPYQCTHESCGKRFTNRGHLKEHVEAIHATHKPFTSLNLT